MLFAYSLFAFFELVKGGQVTRCDYGANCSVNNGVYCNANRNRKVISMTGTFDVNTTAFNVAKQQKFPVYVEYYSSELNNYGKVFQTYPNII